MKVTEIVSIVILVAVLYLVYQLTKTNKAQNEVLLAVAIKTGAVKDLGEEGVQIIKKKKVDKDDNEEEEEEEEEKGGKDNKKGAGVPKQGPKKIHKQFLSLFKDGVPKTTGQIKALYTKNFKELDKTKFNNTLQYMTKMDLLGKDKAEGKQNYWGPIDWFDKDGLMYEDYLEKVEKDDKA